MPLNRLRAAALPVTGAAGVTLTAAGMSGIGDAPDPHDSATSLAAHFLAHRSDILATSGAGYLGSLALIAFSLGLGERLLRRGAGLSAVGTAAAGSVIGTYFLALHLVYDTIAYRVAASSPEGPGHCSS